MRFDEINIIGEFKINGLTGSPGQALGLSGSEFTWITVSASSIIDAVGLTGTDYVICQSVNTGNPGTDAIENGNRLRSAYATASGLYVSNRVSVLITPGDYDLGGEQLYLTTNNVDLIGLSSDASDVILRGSGDYVLQIMNPNTDTALCNITIDGTSTAYYSIDNAENNGCYLRWDNVIARGYMFSDDNFSYSELTGEFKNIKVYDSSYAFYTLSERINGIFENIELTNAPYSFYADGGDLLGTYSNISIQGSVTSAFYTNISSGINATFENIKIGNLNLAFSGNPILGNFRDIEIGDSNATFYVNSSGDISGTFENIKIGNVASYTFYTNSGYLTGTFSNIEVGDCTSIFSTETSGSISGSFKDITTGTSSNIFSVYDNISGTFENIKTGSISQYIFNSLSSGNVLGTFNNIEIGDVAANAFVGGYISGTFSNIKTKDISSDFFISGSNLEGSFENIKTDNLSGSFQSSSGDILGTFKNIEFGNVDGSIFYAGGTISTIFDTITIGDITNDVVFSSGNITGTYSNIQIGNSTNAFQSNLNLTGTYENIKIGTCSSAFISTTSDINGYFDTIEIGDLSIGGSFVAGNDLLGIYKNINIGDATGQILFDSTSYTDGVFENIEIRDCASFFNVGNVNLSGTFSNIKGGNISSSAFTPGTLNLTGYYKDITLGTVGFIMGAGTILSNIIIDNLKVNSYIPAIFPGKIINSFIDARGLANSAIIITDDTIVERSKFLSDSGYYSISSPGEISALISFTITNYGITSSITNNILPADPLNIDNSNIT